MLPTVRDSTDAQLDSVAGMTGQGVAQVITGDNRTGLESHSHALLPGAMGGALVLVFRKAIDNGVSEMFGDSEKGAPEDRRGEGATQLSRPLSFARLEASSVY